MVLFIFCLVCLITIVFIIYFQAISYQSIQDERKFFIIDELAKAHDRVYASLKCGDQKLVTAAIADFDFYVNFYRKHFGADEQYQYWLDKLNEIMTFSK